MAQNIAKNVRSLRSSLREVLPAETVQSACRDAGHRWRVRVLDPVTTIWLFSLQMLHANTACGHVARLMDGVRFTDSAYCQARRRLPTKLFRTLFERVQRSLLAVTHEITPRWNGLRVFFIDGSTASMPDTPELQKRFGQPSGQKDGCGFPVTTIVGLFLRGGMLIEMVTAPLRTSEVALAHVVFKHLKPNDVLVGDRAYSSFGMIARLQQQNVHVVARLKMDRKTHFSKAKRLNKHDFLVKWKKPKKRPTWMDLETFKSLPDELELRQIEYVVVAKGRRTKKVLLVTTLLDDDLYPKRDLESLYNDRWQVETYYRNLKTTLGMDILRCKTLDGIEKEMWMFGIIYNLVCAAILAAADRQGVTPDRISFIDTLRWLCLQIETEETPRLRVNPQRPNRVQPRVRKRRSKQYSLLTKPRAEMLEEMESWTR